MDDISYGDDSVDFERVSDCPLCLGCLTLRTITRAVSELRASIWPIFQIFVRKFRAHFLGFGLLNGLVIGLCIRYSLPLGRLRMF